VRIDPRFAVIGAAVIAAPTLLAQPSEEEAEACGQACGTACGVGIIGIPMVIGLLVSIGIAVWIHRDARQRNNPNPLLWAIIGLFFNVLGLVIYVIVREQGQPPRPMEPPPPPPPSVPPPPWDAPPPPPVP
jgi:hypothetical protein